MLPNHSQIKEDEHPEQLPCFGQPLDDSDVHPDKDPLEEQTEALLASFKPTNPIKSNNSNQQQQKTSVVEDEKSGK